MIKEVINELKKYTAGKKNTEKTEISVLALNRLIFALGEQEDILDKIKEEVKLLSNANPSYWHSGDMVERDDVLEIIDKYKESEVVE